MRFSFLRRIVMALTVSLFLVGSLGAQAPTPDPEQAVRDAFAESAHGFRKLLDAERKDRDLARRLRRDRPKSETAAKRRDRRLAKIEADAEDRKKQIRAWCRDVANIAAVRRFGTRQGKWVVMHLGEFRRVSHTVVHWDGEGKSPGAKLAWTYKAPSGRVLAKGSAYRSKLDRTELSVVSLRVPKAFPRKARRVFGVTTEVTVDENASNAIGVVGTPSSASDAIGLGGSFGGRRGGRHRARRGRGRKAQVAVDNGLAWLAKNQSADGSWAAGKDDVSRVGVTALALLAFVGAGETDLVGSHKETVRRGLDWLAKRQDATGRFQSTGRPGPVPDHATATLAVGELAMFTGRAKADMVYAKSMVHIIAKQVSADGRDGGWGDTSVAKLGDAETTSWILLALVGAKAAGHVVAEDLLRGGIAALDALSDEETGRTGQVIRGALPERRDPARLPPGKSEAPTAMALLARLFTAQFFPELIETAKIAKSSNLVRSRPPEWEARGSDMTYLYFGITAMYQIGDDTWKAWWRSVRDGLSERQRRDGGPSGSWEPIGPRGEVGGRVFSTAMAVLCLETPYRYARRIRPSSK